MRLSVNMSVSVTVNECVCLGVNQSSLCVYQSVSVSVCQCGRMAVSESVSFCATDSV